MTGLVRVMGNVGVLVFWIILAANFISRGMGDARLARQARLRGGRRGGHGRLVPGLSWVVSLGHGKLSEKTLLRMEHISGVGLLILALIHGGTIVWQMHKHG